jgi:hypothetical protein
MLSAFIAEHVEFLVVGAYAMSAHGVARATGDIDFWIRRSEENADRVLRSLAAFGAPLHDLTKVDLLQPDVVFQIGVAPNRIDIITSVTGVEFDAAWPSRLVTSLEGLDVPVLGFDDLITNKRATGRTRDLADVEALEALRREGYSG